MDFSVRGLAPPRSQISFSMSSTEKGRACPTPNKVPAVDLKYRIMEVFARRKNSGKWYYDEGNFKFD
jgi:hypothetical protein